MIKNVIFDYGDIFINLDKPATARELHKLGIDDFTPEMVAKNQAYEKGLISTESFVDFYHQTFPNTTKEALIDAWNAILLDCPKHRLDFIKQLAKDKKYRLFLLSNTNDLHISWIQKDWGMELYDDFKLAYALTVHKSQGSQYENLVIFIDKDQNIWDKAALYTAISRAKKKCIVITDYKTFKNIQLNERSTKEKISLFMRDSNIYDL